MKKKVIEIINSKTVRLQDLGGPFILPKRLWGILKVGDEVIIEWKVV